MSYPVTLDFLAQTKQFSGVFQTVKKGHNFECQVFSDPRNNIG